MIVLVGRVDADRGLVLVGRVGADWARPSPALLKGARVPLSRADEGRGGTVVLAVIVLLLSPVLWGFILERSVEGWFRGLIGFLRR